MAFLTLHIGIPKTGSTFLQEKVFPAAHDLVFLDRPRSDVLKALRGDPKQTDHFARALQLQPEVWDHLGEALLRDVVGNSAEGSRPVLISDEAIGRAASKPQAFRNHMAALVKASRSVGFEGVRVVALTRRQDHWFGSHYAQMSDRNLAAGQHDFEEMVRFHTDPGGGFFGFGQLLRYDRLFDSLCSACGEENVFLRPFEMMERDPTVFFEDLGGFLGCALPAPNEDDRSNVRRQSEGEWRLRPLRNPLLRFKPREESVRLTPSIEEAVRTAYGPPNREAAERTGIDFGTYGYPVS